MPGSEPVTVQQVLTVAQMRAAEERLIEAGSSVDALMQVAGRGAAEWVWRVAGHHPVTVLCGPGNNGGDGYVIAEAIRERGGRVRVIAACEPKTDAARTARGLFGGEVLGPEAAAHGDVLVDCLFGSGLARSRCEVDGAHRFLRRGRENGDGNAEVFGISSSAPGGRRWLRRPCADGEVPDADRERCGIRHRLESRRA